MPHPGLIAVTLSLVFVVPALAGPVRPQLPDIEPTNKLYKRAGGALLEMTIYNPPGHKATDKRAAVVFFFGGGWRSGSTKQFAPQCRYLAGRGMVAMAADYRVKSRHGVSPFECVADAKSAIRWVRANAEDLGVDPDRIAAGGGSAGGHLAACTGIIKGYEEKGEDTSISSVPNAMLLFNPAVDVTVAGFPGANEERIKDIYDRFKGKPRDLSPTYHLRAGLPPTIVFHGMADQTVPYAQAEAFAKAMKALGNRCELVGAGGAGHGYFNYGRGDGRAFVQTLIAADKFLVSLGYLKGEPTLKAD